MPSLPSLHPSCASVAVLAALQGLAPAQSRDDVYFSVTWRGPTIGLASGNDRVTSGDILQPQAPGTSLNAPPPKIFRSAASTGLQGQCEERPGTPCGQEMDALSFGHDARLGPEPSERLAIHFSVDRHAHATAASFLQPGTWTEAVLHDHGADAFAALWAGAPDPGTTGHNFIAIDGDGRAAAGGLGARRHGTGLVEPNDPAIGWPMAPHDRGDDLDALDVGTPREHVDGRFYFSVQGGGVDVLDPIGSPPVPSTAELEGISAADVVMGSPGQPHRPYARAALLGLDALLDDIDALILSENGVPGYQPPPRPMEWASAEHDMLIFSVRRGSAVIGERDSALGLRITEGDLLTAPAVLGDAPAIVATAESLGLRVERGDRSGASDELDAASVDEYDFPDCNSNLVDDTVDISWGVSFDLNNDAIPDECQYEGGDFGQCTSGSSATCLNVDFWAGCENSTGVGGGLHCLGPVDATDVFQFSGTNLPPSGIAAILYSDSVMPLPATTGNGLLFVQPGATPWIGSVHPVSIDGTVLVNPGILAWLGASAPTAGQTAFFQLLYQDPGGPCGGTMNLTNGVKLIL